MKSVYRKFTDQIAADAARAAASTPNPADFSWLVGEWTWHGQSVRFAAVGYGISRDGVPFLIYNAAAGVWILTLSNPSGFGILIGLPLRDRQARFIGDVTIDGQPVRLRQTWRVRNDGEVDVSNERMIDGLWRRWDGGVLARTTPPS